MNEIPDLSSQQAGRYMSDAEIDADRMALMEWLSDYGVLPTGYHRLFLHRYKESLTRIAPDAD